MAHSRICRTVNKFARATTTTRILGSHTDSVLVARQVSGRGHFFFFFFFSVPCFRMMYYARISCYKRESAAFTFKYIRSAFTLKYNGKVPQWNEKCVLSE